MTALHRMRGLMLLHEFSDRTDDIFDLFVRQFGKDRQRKRIIRGTIGNRKIFPLIQIPEAFLFVERDRIIDVVPDPFLRDELPQSIPFLNSDDVLIKNMMILDAGCLID